MNPNYPAPSGPDTFGAGTGDYPLNFYQRDIQQFRKYPQPGDGTEQMYCAMGIVNEVGEFTGKLKKIMRGDHGSELPPFRTALLLELGDVLWYAAALASEYELDFYRNVVGNLPLYQGTESFAKLPREAWASGSPLRRVVTEAMGMASAAGGLAAYFEKVGMDYLPGWPSAATRDEESRRQQASILMRLTTIVAYVDWMARFLGSSLPEVAGMNLSKLTGRAARGTIQGDGDER